MRYRWYTLLATITVWAWHRTTHTARHLARLADRLEQKTWNT